MGTNIIYSLMSPPSLYNTYLSLSARHKMAKLVNTRTVLVFHKRSTSLTRFCMYVRLFQFRNVPFSHPHKTFSIFGRSGYWTLIYTGTQSLITNEHNIYYLTLIGLYKQAVSKLLNLKNLNFWCSKFVYHHWRCTSIYRSLSYPLN